MRFDGILRSWNEERGFGFIAPTRGGAEVFVHISAFARDGSRPVVGETLSFELGRGRDGKPQAIHVIRAAIGTPTPAPRRSPPESARRPSAGGGWIGKLVSIAVAAALAWWMYGRYEAGSERRRLEAMPAAEIPQPSEAPAGVGFRCDGRTQCSQMTSCAEATWFINHCPGTQMDGNHDGVPCEQQWCTGLGSR